MTRPPKRCRMCGGPLFRRHPFSLNVFDEATQAERDTVPCFEGTVGEQGEWVDGCRLCWLESLAETREKILANRARRAPGWNTPEGNAWVYTFTGIPDAMSRAVVELGRGANPRINPEYVRAIDVDVVNDEVHALIVENEELQRRGSRDEYTSFEHGWSDRYVATDFARRIGGRDDPFACWLALGRPPLGPRVRFDGAYNIVTDRRTTRPGAFDNITSDGVTTRAFDADDMRRVFEQVERTPRMPHRLGGIPVVLDPTMPVDEVDLRGADGSRVTLRNFAPFVPRAPTLQELAAMDFDALDAEAERRAREEPPPGSRAPPLVLPFALEELPNVRYIPGPLMEGWPPRVVPDAPPARVMRDRPSHLTMTRENMERLYPGTPYVDAGGGLVTCRVADLAPLDVAALDAARDGDDDV